LPRSASRSPRPCAPTWPPTRKIVGSSRPRLGGRFTTRRVEQIVKRYAEAAGVKATPHTFRHKAITWLTRHSGMADAELQLITGHAKCKTLPIYQHLARRPCVKSPFRIWRKKRRCPNSPAILRIPPAR
jgi:integrase